MLEFKIVLLSGKLLVDIKADENNLVADIKKVLWYNTLYESDEFFHLDVYDFDLVYNGEIMDFRKRLGDCDVKNNDNITFVSSNYPDNEMVVIGILVRYNEINSPKYGHIEYEFHRDITMKTLVKYFSEKHDIHNEVSQVIARLNSVEMYSDTSEDYTINYIKNNYGDLSHLEILLYGNYLDESLRGDVVLIEG